MTQARLPTCLKQPSLYAEARDLNIYGEEEKKSQEFPQNNQVTWLARETKAASATTRPVSILHSGLWGLSVTSAPTPVHPEVKVQSTNHTTLQTHGFPASSSLMFAKKNSTGLKEPTQYKEKPKALFNPVIRHNSGD